MPRKAVADDDDDEMPRRRRRGNPSTGAVEERGLLMRILLHSPKDTVAAVLTLAAAAAIISNALFLQHGPHPAPMFGSVLHLPPATAVTASMLPRPRPAEADVASSEPRLLEPHANEVRAGERPADPLGNLVKSTTTTPVPSGAAPPAPTMLRPPAPIPVVQLTGARRVAAVQRALTEYGYGQLKATGTVGADTQAAIQKFERERRLPATGQVSDRLVRELTAMIGHPID